MHAGDDRRIMTTNLRRRDFVCAIVAKKKMSTKKLKSNFPNLSHKPFHVSSVTAQCRTVNLNGVHSIPLSMAPDVMSPTTWVMSSSITLLGMDVLTVSSPASS